jgi:uncharacterized spore protein YtfJ
VSETDVAALLGRIGDSISGHKSFGPSYEKDGILVIPVAYVFGGGGGGESDEAGQPGKDKPDKPETNQKKGAGGGYGLVTWPIGAYVVQDGQVRFVPVVDPALLMTTGALAIAMLIRSLRRKRRRAHRRHDR